jgi:hypothetical protein
MVKEHFVHPFLSPSTKGSGEVRRRRDGTEQQKKIEKKADQQVPKSQDRALLITTPATPQPGRSG